MSFNNTTGVTPFVDHGPYYMQYGAERIFDALYLTILTVVGTFGNLLVILSIIYAGRVNKNGNIFIINLAIADLIVSAVLMGVNKMLTELSPHWAYAHPSTLKAVLGSFSKVHIKIYKKFFVGTTIKVI